MTLAFGAASFLIVGYARDRDSLLDYFCDDIAPFPCSDLAWPTAQCCADTQLSSLVRAEDSHHASSEVGIGWSNLLTACQTANESLRWTRFGCRRHSEDHTVASFVLLTSYAERRHLASSSVLLLQEYSCQPFGDSCCFAGSNPGQVPLGRSSQYWYALLRFFGNSQWKMSNSI